MAAVLHSSRTRSADALSRRRFSPAPLNAAPKTTPSKEQDGADLRFRSTLSTHLNKGTHAAVHDIGVSWVPPILLRTLAVHATLYPLCVCTCVMNITCYSLNLHVCYMCRRVRVRARATSGLPCVYLGPSPDLHHFSADSSIPPSLRLFTSLPQTALLCVPASNFFSPPLSSLALRSLSCGLFSVFWAPIIPSGIYRRDFLSLNRNWPLFPRQLYRNPLLSVHQHVLFLPHLSFLSKMEGAGNVCSVEPRPLVAG